MSPFVPYLPGALAVLAASVIAATAATYAANTAARISYSNKISEFRQNWIDELRKDIADYCAASELWMRKWDELNTATVTDQASMGQRERNESLPLSVSARTILNRIKLRINPRLNKHKDRDDKFIIALEALLDPSKLGLINQDAAWRRLSDDVIAQAREILKEEWTVTKLFKAFKT